MLSLGIHHLLLILLSSCQAFVVIQSSRYNALENNQNNQHLLVPQANSDGCAGGVPPLTVLLPAYNESLRIGETLHLYHTFLEQQWNYSSSEILVVDDGSLDGTGTVVQTYAKQLHDNNKNDNNKDSTSSAPNIQCISLESNQGKGAALAEGIRHVSSLSSSNGHPQQNALILIADADGSADIQCLMDMLVCLEELTRGEGGKTDWSLPALVVGRRIYDNNKSDQQSSWNPRLILRWGFRTAVRVLCGDLGGVTDTQCGFKLFTLRAAEQLYSDLYLTGWSHDVEVLYRAKARNFAVAQHDVKWVDKSGSKLVTSAGGTIGASFQMLLEISQLRLLYSAGIWKLPPPPPLPLADQ